MTDDTFAERDLLAAEYALGTLDSQTRQRVTRELASDPALQRLVDAWSARLAPLDDATTPLQPPAQVWSSIERGIAAAANESRGSRTVRADEGVWEEIAPGVTLKLLLEDPDSEMQSIVIRMDAGARLPPHDHRLAEECFVMEGDMSIGDLHLRAGDYHVAFADTSHAEIVSRTGGVIFIRREIPG